ncbi:MAG: putative membrane protein [uncultured Sulfurovum sp.]|uniref:Putative membrane protein n=1 Tax=uncultured Sulfurovum sp. TaxID=269237 RepID=A0A6S6U751_9BACT|nr:MAG: putative membrane protein [uncultured Sulfurovum sp.]
MKFLFFMLLSIHLYAHQNSLALLSLDVQGSKLQGSYKLAIKDAQTLVNLDTNFDTKVTWREILAQEERLKTKIQTQLVVTTKLKPCSLTLDAPMLLDYLDSNKYLHFNIRASCQEKIELLGLKYSLLFDKDRLHKAYVNILANGKSHNTLFSEDKLETQIDLKASSFWNTFYEFIKQGIIHIFIGIDHILFLIALLLPSVLFRHQKKWQPNVSFKSTFINVLKIVTAFTVAHSITLSLSILGLISLPSWLIESFIAFSVVLAALNNFTGTIEKRLWILVFIFGLIHGMGFASVLMDLELQESSLILALLGFNLGVELGQIAIVSLLVPFIYVLRTKRWYVPMVLYFGSLLIVLMGSVWLWERVSEGLSL